MTIESARHPDDLSQTLASLRHIADEKRWERHQDQTLAVARAIQLNLPERYKLSDLAQAVLIDEPTAPRRRTRGRVTVQPPTLGWSEWIPLDERSSLRQLPATAGLYRVRAVDDALLAYVGQTGRSLRERVSALRGAFGREMPYRDPHTAAPALWAWLQSVPVALIVGVCPIDGDTPCRKALEAIIIAEHRQQHGVSPRWNFGRMPAGFHMSSANNTALVAAAKRRRGGTTGEMLPAHAPGIAPQGPLDDHVQADCWCSHHWGSWHRLNEQEVAATQPGSGLYRIRGRSDQLVYIGEGNVRDRLRIHAGKLRHTSSQGTALAAAAPLEYSAVLNPCWLPHERLELETDLIAAHTIAFAAPPAAQFIG